jgi:hypothetical protein
VQDEEIVPLLRAAGLDEAATRAAAMRLLGNQLTVCTRVCKGPTPGAFPRSIADLPRLALQMNYQQFAAAMLEEEITGEPFPKVLLQMARAFSNIDVDDRLCVSLLFICFALHSPRSTAPATHAVACAVKSMRPSCSSFSGSWE